MPVLQQDSRQAQEPAFTVTFDGPRSRGRFVLRANDQGEAELAAERAMGEHEHVVAVVWGDRT